MSTNILYNHTSSGLDSQGHAGFISSTVALGLVQDSIDEQLLDWFLVRLVGGLVGAALLSEASEQDFECQSPAPQKYAARHPKCSNTI